MRRGYGGQSGVDDWRRQRPDIRAGSRRCADDMSTAMSPPTAGQPRHISLLRAADGAIEDRSSRINGMLEIATSECLM